MNPLSDELAIGYDDGSLIFVAITEKIILQKIEQVLVRLI